MARFEQNFELERGDLIYGLAKARMRYIREYLGYGKGDDIPYITIDQYNEHVPTLPGGNLAAEPVPNPAYNDHRARLEAHAKYSPRTLHVATPANEIGFGARQDIRRHDAKLQREVGGPRDGGRIFDPTPREKLAFRRSSKFGIEYVIQATTAHIHFVLDDITSATSDTGKTYRWGRINMAEIVPQNGMPEIKGSITGSELRYVYRNWDAIGETNRLHFYLLGEETVPPWEQDDWRAMWEGYRQHRSEKADRVARERVVAQPRRGFLARGRGRATVATGSNEGHDDDV